MNVVTISLGRYGTIPFTFRNDIELFSEAFEEISGTSFYDYLSQMQEIYNKIVAEAEAKGIRTREGFKRFCPYSIHSIELEQFNASFLKQALQKEDELDTEF